LSKDTQNFLKADILSSKLNNDNQFVERVNEIFKNLQQGDFHGQKRVKRLDEVMGEINANYAESITNSDVMLSSNNEDGKTNDLEKGFINDYGFNHRN